MTTPLTPPAVLRKPWHRRWYVRLPLGLCVVYAIYWLVNLWRYETNAVRLRAAMGAAASDTPEWQWGEAFESGAFAVGRDNVAADLTTWMLSRGMTEKWPRKAPPAWLGAYQNWERTNYTFQYFNDTVDAEIRSRPNALLPVKIRNDLSTIFSGQDALADFAELRGWVDRPAGRYAYRPEGLNILILLPMTQKIRELANVLAWDAQVAVEQGKPDQALRDLRTIAMVARSFGDDPIMIAQLVRMAVGDVGVRKLNRVLAQAERFDPQQLALLQAEYLAEAERPIFLALARGQRAFLFHDFQVLERDATLRRKALNRGIITTWEPDTKLNWLNDWIKKLTPTAYYFPSAAEWPREQAAVLEYHNAFVDIAKLPEGEWLTALGRLPARDQLPSFTQNVLEVGWFGSSNEHSPYVRIVRALLRYRASLRSGAAACAAERFRLENGRWPTGFEELVSKYLPAAPVDPFTQKPLIWKVVDDGVVIYSVGIDGKDDGGNVLEVGGYSPKDTGMRLWSPAARKQAAIPYEK